MYLPEYLENLELLDLVKPLLVKSKTIAKFKSCFISWNNAKRLAGEIHYGPNIIKLHVNLLKNPKHLKTTLLHEVAHLIAYYEYGDHGHGYSWKKVMRDLRQDPKRCHNYDNIKIDKHNATRKYVCPRCSNVMYTARKLKRKYIHTQCGGIYKEDIIFNIRKQNPHLSLNDIKGIFK